MKATTKTTSKQTGFTIIELMIAMLVFSVVIMMVTAVVIFIGKQFTQAQTRTALEDATRNVYQDISSSIQFGGTSKNVAEPNLKVFCVGSKRYVYGNYSKANYSTMQTGLWVMDYDGASCSVPPLPLPGVNILPPNSRVLALTYSGNDLTIITSSADEDLLDFGSGDATEVQCNSTLAGKEFCAVVNLNGSVVSRLHEE